MNKKPIGRFWDWSLRLDEVIKLYRDSEAQYGKTDCCCFVRDSVQATIDYNVMSDFAMNYKTARGALGELKRCANVTTPEELMDKMLGDRQSLTYAQKGDVVSAEIEGEDNAVGICFGRMSVFMHIKRGLISIPTLDCHASWRI